MNCSQCFQKLPDFLDQLDAGTLNDAARVEWEATLEECPECAREWRLALQVRQTLRQLPEPAAPTRLRANVRVAIRQQAAPRESLWSTWIPRARPFVWAGGAGMAALLLWIGTGGQLPTPSTQIFTTTQTDTRESAPTTSDAPLTKAKTKAAPLRKPVAPATNASTKPKPFPTPAPNPISPLPAPPAPENALDSDRETRARPQRLEQAKAPSAAIASSKRANPPRTSMDVSGNQGRTRAPRPGAPIMGSSTPQKLSPPRPVPATSTRNSRENRSAIPNAPVTRPNLRAGVPPTASRRTSEAPLPVQIPAPQLRAGASSNGRSAAQALVGASSTNDLRQAGVTLFAVALPLARTARGLNDSESLRARPSIAAENAPARLRRINPPKSDDPATANGDVAREATSDAPSAAVPAVPAERDESNRFLQPRADFLAPKPSASAKVSSTTRRVRLTLRSQIALQNLELRPIDAPLAAAALWRGDLAANAPTDIDVDLPANSPSTLRLKLQQAGASQSKPLELSVSLPSP